MSGLPPLATEEGTSQFGSFVPIAEERMRAAYWRLLSLFVRFVSGPKGPGPAILHHDPRKRSLARRTRRVICISVSFDAPVDVHERHIRPYELHRHLFIRPDAVTKLSAMLL